MRQTILLADDSPTIQRLVNSTFADTRFDIVTVNNGDAAIRKFDEIEPDVVLADIYMPGKNGYEVCAHVKAHPSLSGTPVILLVGAFDAYDEATATQAGATAHITKPFEPRALVELVISTAPEEGKARKPANDETSVTAEAPPLPEKLRLVESAPAGKPAEVPMPVEKPAEEPAEEPAENEVPSVAENAVIPAAIAVPATPPVPVASVVPAPAAAVETGDLLGLNHLFQPDAGAAGSVAAQLTDDDVDRIADRVIRKLSPKVIEGIAWDVVPDIAVKILRDELKKNKLMKVEISKTYNPQEVESRWYGWWESKGYFRADAASSRPSFVIMMPPPNVTGSLHIGHMLNNTVQDVIVRRKRMKGFNTLWLPGMDHAGIATQWVVERELRAEGLTRHDLGREAFVCRVWKWKEEYGGNILKQIRRIGSSCDWSRERFTLDERLSRAVREVFVRLHEEGLIYRGKRLINWCPRCMSALSDLEVKPKTSESKLYHIKYPLKGQPGEFVEVATTRPETMLGDTAIAVNPEDKRYKGFIGRSAVLPLVGREIPFIEDTAVDPKFGTGAVKVTPAHDLADFEMGQRHNLAQITVIGEDAKITAEGGVYQGMDRFAARKKIVEDLDAQGLLVKVEALTNNIGQCDRCSTVVEPLISTQWFIRIQPLAEPAIRAVEDGRMKFVPSNWSKTYFEWMNNIRDWCISRQLWWGHRIPAWYCECGEVIVARVDPEKCSKCGSSKLRQDQDVLDTWFSSGLWPFSTLGWPDQTEDLKAFYPGSLLVTGYDIIFFWVARMMMFGLKFMDDVPFRAVYITGMIRDAERQKMSKSKGNVVDPLEICDKYGTDAVRFAFARMGAPGTDLALSDKQLESYKFFATKIWNAARFMYQYVDESDHLPSIEELRGANLPLVDRWILARLAIATQEVRMSMEQYHLHEAARSIYRFFWDEFCSWYLEMIKLHPERSKPTLLFVFESALRLLHPFMPFITEELWQSIPHKGESIVIAPYPELESGPEDSKSESDTEMIQDFITKVRNIRAEYSVDSKQAVSVRVATSDARIIGLLKDAGEYIHKLAQVSEVSIVEQLSGDKLSAQAVAAGCAIEVPLAGVIDLAAEMVRLTKLRAKALNDKSIIEKQLSNPDVVARAPAEVIDEKKRQLAELEDQIRKLTTGIDRLN